MAGHQSAANEFIKKPEVDGIRYKARLVAKVFAQKYGEDYDEVFAPVARALTIRLLLSMAGKKKFHIRQFHRRSYNQRRTFWN